MAGKKAGNVRKSFTAVLEPDGTALKWTVVRVPFDVMKAWPVRKGRRVKGEMRDSRSGPRCFLIPKAGAMCCW